jgi:resuscitation-promoting factor RpfA
MEPAERRQAWALSVALTVSGLAHLLMLGALGAPAVSAFRAAPPSSSPWPAMTLVLSAAPRPGPAAPHASAAPAAPKATVQGPAHVATPAAESPDPGVPLTPAPADAVPEASPDLATLEAVPVVPPAARPAAFGMPHIAWRSAAGPGPWGGPPRTRQTLDLDPALRHAMARQQLASQQSLAMVSQGPAPTRPLPPVSDALIRCVPSDPGLPDPACARPPGDPVLATAVAAP